MARESIQERRARLAPGARWLTAQRESRGLSGRELARRLGINADRIFAYERAQDEPGKDFIAMLAAEYGMSQVDVWRGLAKPLPDEFESDEALADYWQDRAPGIFKRVAELTGEDTEPRDETPGPGDRHARVTRKPVARKSGEEPRKPRRRASGG